MAKEIAKLLRTEMAADVTALPMLAKLLQSYGRKGDKMLAHITPEEARMLEDEGGSGTINPNTGLPEYYDGDFMTDTSQEMGSFTPEAAAQQFPEYYPQGEVPQAGEVTTFAPSEGGVIPTYGAPQIQDFFAARGLPAGTTPLEASAPSVPLSPAMAPGMQYQTPEQIAAAAAAAPAPQEKGFLDKLGLTKEQALRLGLGGLGALTTGLAGQRGIRQAEQARREIADIGKPYQETGKQLQAQALRGELTPAGQQQVQAAQAQLAQGAERRGGVGAQQAATQIQAFRQNLLDQQYNYGLKVAQIGDAYAANAIRTGLTADQEMAKLMANITGTLGATLGGIPNVPGTPTARS
jgi:hypothetical protein